MEFNKVSHWWVKSSSIAGGSPIAGGCASATNDTKTTGRWEGLLKIHQGREIGGYKRKCMKHIMYRYVLCVYNV